MTDLLTRLKAFAGIAEHYVVSLGKRELHIALNSTLGEALKAAVTAGDQGTTAAQKMTLALAALMPTLKSYTGNLTALETDLETVGRSMLEDVLAQVKQTGPAMIFEALEAVV